MFLSTFALTVNMKLVAGYLGQAYCKMREITNFLVMCHTIFWLGSPSVIFPGVVVTIQLWEKPAHNLTLRKPQKCSFSHKTTTKDI